MRLYVRVALALLISFIAVAGPYLVAAVRSQALGFGDASAALPWGRVATLFVAMLAGITANAVWTALPRVTDAQQRASMSTAFHEAINSAAFIRAVVVSPLVLLAVYSLVHAEPDIVVAHLLAFQNGFFWDAVMRGRAPEGSRVTGGT